MSNPSYYMNNPDEFKRNLYKAYKKTFSGAIKESFLINMVARIEKDPRFAVIFFNNNDINKMLSLENTAIGKGSGTSNLCREIVMCHYFNTVTLGDDERGKRQDSEHYKSKLVEEVINMCKVEKLATPDYNNSSLEAFLPIIYYVSALSGFLGYKWNEIKNSTGGDKVGHNIDFNDTMIFKILLRIKACVNLADLRATDELMIVYRSLIELFMTYSALWDKSDDIICSYYDYDQITLDYNYNGKIPDSVVEKAKKLGANKVSLANYGWMSELEEFKTIGNCKNAFSLGGLAKVLDKKCEYFCEDFGTALYKCYKACNPQTHGTMAIMNYLELELSIFENIAVMLKFLCDVLSNNFMTVDFHFGDIDLIDEIDKSLDQSRKISIWLNSDEKKLEKTNLDYRNRAICCIRMKN